MGTIAERKRKDGTIGYTAQVRLKRGGKLIHHESQTFDRRRAAMAWISRREEELAVPGALERVQQDDPPLRDVINRYLAEYGLVRNVGKTKAQCLKAIAASPLGTLQASTITSADLVAHARRRITENGIQPQTVGNDFAHLGAVFAVARPAWGIPLNDESIRQARAVTKKLGLTSSSKERNRRPTLDELDLLMRHFGRVRSRRVDSIPMQAIIAFAIFSSRRQEEIVKIRWDDLDEAESTILVRAMKNPNGTDGNDVTCHLPARALAIIQSRPRRDARIFPHNTDAISAAFTRACQLLGIVDLHFHDLRREAISHLFELGQEIPQVAAVSAHRDWNMMRRYTKLRGKGDKYAGWAWWDVVLACH